MNIDLLLVSSAMLIWGLGEGMFLFFQPLYLQQLGASPILIGAILSAWAVAMTVTHIPAGHLSDRIGRRPLMWSAWSLGCLATLIMALANSLPAFVAGLIIYGLTSFVIAPMDSYVTAARGNWTVGRAITTVSAAYYLGAVAGPVLGGWIGTESGLHRIYMIAAGLFAVSTLFIFMIHAQPVEPTHTEAKTNGLPFNRKYIHFLGMVFLAILATYLPQPLASNFLQNQQGLEYTQIGQLGSISSLGAVAFSLLLGHLDARLGFLVGQAATGLFAFILWKTSSLPWFFAGYFMLGGYRLARTLAVAQTRDLVPPARMGLAYGLTETTSATATILAPLLAGYLYQLQPVWMFSTGFLLMIFSILAGIHFFSSYRTSASQNKAEEVGG